MAATIASLLTDFSNSALGEAPGIGLLRPARPAPEENPVPHPPVVDRQAEVIKALEARARDEERAIARRELEEAINAEKARHLEDINDQRTIWIEQQALQLATQISSAVERIEENISDKVANILRPFVSEAFRQQSLSEFKDVLATLLSGRDATLVKVAGPEDLLSAMKPHLGSCEGLIEWLPGDHVEVSVVAQDTLVQTQLSSWSGRLAQAFESN